MSDLETVPRAEDLWSCPACRGLLDTDRERWQCLTCEARYGARRGVPCFSAADEFYEGRFQTTKEGGVRSGLLGRLERHFGEFRILRFLDRWVPEGTTVLDLGCGGGRRFLAERGRRTIGIDLSLASLAVARDVYDDVARADLTRLPLPDRSVDVVVSVDVLEHVPPGSKDLVLAEMLRVLRPGGRLVHYYDVDSRKCLHRWAKKFPELYAAVHVQQHGHIGLEPIRESWARFRSAGLRPLCELAHNKSNLLYPETAEWMLSGGYADKALWARFTRSFAQFLLARPRLRRVHRVATILYYDAVERWLPDEHAFSSAVCYEKPLLSRAPEPRSEHATLDQPRGVEAPAGRASTPRPLA
ncbi:MAG: class I SAM-dependent methyltransferase [Planctomycetota bacterium]